MVLRTWTAVARSPSEAADYADYLRTTVFPHLHTIDGHLGAYLCPACGHGRPQLDVETQDRDELERTFPAAPPGPAVAQWSMDGAFVPLVGGDWAEVKTAAIGTVTTRRNKAGEREVHTTDLSYCSRLADVASFGRRFQLEVFYRGTQTAGTVVAVQDGADWIQGLFDTYRRDAVRVLDFAHLVEHLATAARAVYGADSPGFQAWLAVAAHILKHRGPDEILVELRQLPISAAARSRIAGMT